MDFWSEAATPDPDTVAVDGIELGPGSRVLLRPRPGRDVLDLVLAGRPARIESLQHDIDGSVQVAVTLEDDPGRDLGEGRYPGHRFFFGLDEVEPLPAQTAAGPRVLLAGIGNVFLGDDAFGVALAERLAGRTWPAGVEVRDFGIRGLDLAYALPGYDAAVLLDALPRGEAPGTLYLIEPVLEPGAPAAVETHGMDPVKVLHLARALGGTPPRTLVVGCEPRPFPAELDPTEVVAGLSEPVAAALDEAVRMVESLVDSLLSERR